MDLTIPQMIEGLGELIREIDDMLETLQNLDLGDEQRRMDWEHDQSIEKRESA